MTNCRLENQRGPGGRRGRRRCFTLLELILAGVVGSMVIAAVMSIMIFSLRTWQTGLAQWELAQQMRLAREKILRGIEGRIGLRQAEESSIHIFPGKSPRVEWIDFDVDRNDVPTPDRHNDNLRCRIIKNPGLSLAARTTPGSGKPMALLRTSIEPSVVEIQKVGRELIYELTLSLTRGGRTYSRSKIFRTYLVND